MSSIERRASLKLEIFVNINLKLDETSLEDVWKAQEACVNIRNKVLQRCKKQRPVITQ
jgi:hypothetical protein